ncbi:MAG: glycosyltransferase [Chloroflexia bacterium]|nr:glycosyltransferase [Chloroflexia bacterium]
MLLLNASFLNNLGLLDGKMGIALFLYHYARYTKNEIYSNYAGELIDEIYVEVNNNTPFDLANGLTGISLGLEYLVINNFVEADLDAILEEIDEMFLKNIQLEESSNGLDGLLLYGLSLFKSDNCNRRKLFLKSDSLQFLLNECEKFLINLNLREHLTFSNFATLNIINVFLSEVEKTNIIEPKFKILVNYLISISKINAYENLKPKKQNLVEYATLIIWQQLVCGHQHFSDIDRRLLFLDALNYLDENNNWETTINLIENKNLGLNNGLAGIGFIFLQLLSYSNLNSKQCELNKAENAQYEKLDNKLSLFIFKSNARGMQYGMGTYIRELTEALLIHTDIKIFIVDYLSREFNEFTIEEISTKYIKISIPSPILDSQKNNSFINKYASSVVKLLGGVISKCENIVFQFNYLDGLPIIKKLKGKYPYPVISIVHFAQWQELFKGNGRKLDGLNIDFPTNNIEFTLFSEKEMYLLSDRIVSVTKYMKDFLIENYKLDPSKIEVIPNGLNYSKCCTLKMEERLKLKNTLGFNSHEKIILFSGRIDPSKGIYFLFGRLC